MRNIIMYNIVKMAIGEILIKTHQKYREKMGSPKSFYPLLIVNRQWDLSLSAENR